MSDLQIEAREPSLVTAYQLYDNDELDAFAEMAIELLSTGLNRY